MKPKTKQTLPERDDRFAFEHHPSEVNYGGKMRFHQAAFPAAEPGAPHLEDQVHRAVQRLVLLLMEPPAVEKEDAVLAPPELVDIYYDQWLETPRLTKAAFAGWVRKDIGDIANTYLKMRVNAFVQENRSGVERLHYLVALAVTQVCAEVITEYFEKSMEQLGRIATCARLTLGRCLSLVFRAVENSEPVQQARTAARVGASPEVLRLLNPLNLAFCDAADAGLQEEILTGPNPYGLTNKTRNRLMSILETVVAKSDRFTATDPSRAFAEPASLAMLLESRPDRRRLLGLFRGSKDLRQSLVFENCLINLRRALRQCAAASGSEVVTAFLGGDRKIGELLLRFFQRRKLMRHLRRNRTQGWEKVQSALRQGVRLVRRSRRRWWFGLTPANAVEQIQQGLTHLKGLLSQTEDFRLLRSRYGRDSNQGVPWKGLKLWRSYTLDYDPAARSHAERLRWTLTWDRRDAEAQNAFAEGNLFFCRAAGDIYPDGDQRRRQTVFLFADLRNSTETTMRLTKDTASYLTPYLTAVDSQAVAAQGERIYFAGDGYAAYYGQPELAIRAAYSIHARFNRLKTQAAEALRQKAKQIYSITRDLEVQVFKPAAVKKFITSLPPEKNLPPEVSQFLIELASQDDALLTQDLVSKLLTKVAAEYAMPRIDAGIALTYGELFFAMVGEDGQTKTPIVISPALTQAARLSGSSDLVKKHIDDQYGDNFPFQVCAWENKLYNRGILITKNLFEELKKKVDLYAFKESEIKYNNEKLWFYLDPVLKKNIILREIGEPVMLKGIEKPCYIFEVGLPGSFLDKLEPKTPISSSAI